MVKGKCGICKIRGNITKHSLIGNHQPPFVYVCRECHDKIHRKKVPKEIKIWIREKKKQLVPYLNYYN